MNSPPGAALSRFWSTFGPGLLWAATAIGVSHLVQSTRAGADAGFSLVWVVVLALAVKYPFFEFGPRYAAVKGESLVEGYRRLGRWAVWIYLLITLSTALIIQSAVTLFTSFLFAHLFGVEWPMAVMGAIVLTGCGLLLSIGRFRALDRTIKLVLLVLAVCTIVAAITTLPRVAEAPFAPWPLAEGSGAVGFMFILALAGWMPSAIDISVWSSLWTLAKNRSSGVSTTLSEALLDFRIGYLGTAFIALAFLTVGATVMHVADERFSAQGAVFSLQIVDLYTATLGEWSRPVIFVAVLTTMFSTTLTVMDGFPRAIDASFQALRRSGAARDPQEPNGNREVAGLAYWSSLIVLAILTVVVFARFQGNLTTMVDFATVVSFLTSPVLGYLNLRAVTSPEFPELHRPGRGLRIFSYLGLALMGITGLVFVATLFL